MPQVKKSDVREAILASAFELFSEKGYTSTTVAEIARASNMTVANLYVYFPSKLILLYAVYRPWLTGQLNQLRDAVLKCRSPRARLRRIALGLWRDIPSTDHCIANAIVDALASIQHANKKPNDLLVWVEGFLTELIREVLPEERQHLLRGQLLSHIMWMAFDGFAVNRRLGDVRDMDAIADLWADLLLGAARS